jgi:deaminated glutathione amidase
MKLRIATCQFPTNGNPRKNCLFISRQMREAARRGAHVAHFAETALPGYFGVDVPEPENFDWAVLHTAMREIMALARQLRIWVVVGSAHPLSLGRKPHNSAYVINDRGQIVDRYDKRFCTGAPHGRSGDLRYYTPGDHFVTFTIRGHRCGVLICHDFRYPELSREQVRLGVKVMFYSFHNGRFSAEKYAGKGRVMATVVPATMQTYAANNHQWVSAANTSRRHSCWGASTVQPDGRIAKRLPRQRTAVLITDVDPVAEYYDASRSWRDRALRGVLHSGRLARDRRSQNRQSL